MQLLIINYNIVKWKKVLIIGVSGSSEDSKSHEKNKEGINIIYSTRNSKTKKNGRNKEKKINNIRFK